MMKSVIDTWKNIVEHDKDINFALDFLDFAVDMWGEEIYEEIDGWMIGD